jgi:hypothetical protein
LQGPTTEPYQTIISQFDRALQPSHANTGSATKHNKAPPKLYLRNFKNHLYMLAPSKISGTAAVPSSIPQEAGE